MQTAILKIIRACSLHIATPFSYINEILEKGIQMLHAAFNVNIHDPRITASTNFYIHVARIHEDTAGNPFHLVAILLTMIMCLGRRGLRVKKELVKYLTAVTGSFLLFAFIVKWDPHQSRFHLPLLFAT